MATRKIRKGMEVIILTGRDRNKRGRVLFVNTEKDRVIVEGVNVIKRSTRPTQANPSGGSIQREAAIHISNVAAIDPEDNAAVRVGFEGVGGRKVRVARRSGKVIVTETGGAA